MAILVEHTCSKKNNIWKYHETNISCAHILELYIFTWMVQTVALDCVWKFTIYVSRLAKAWRHRDNPPYKVHEYTAVTCQSSTHFHLKYSYWVWFLRLWIIYKGTKPLCLGPLKHGETWSICHKNYIYLSTTMRTQVSLSRFSWQCTSV